MPAGIKNAGRKVAGEKASIAGMTGMSVIQECCCGTKNTLKAPEKESPVRHCLTGLYVSTCGLDGTRTRDLLRDRQAF
jgi:hypothetical protein